MGINERPEISKKSLELQLEYQTLVRLLIFQFLFPAIVLLQRYIIVDNPMWTKP